MKKTSLIGTPCRMCEHFAIWHRTFYCLPHSYRFSYLRYSMSVIWTSTAVDMMVALSPDVFDSIVDVDFWHLYVLRYVEPGYEASTVSCPQLLPWHGSRFCFTMLCVCPDLGGQISWYVHAHWLISCSTRGLAIAAMGKSEKTARLFDLSHEGGCCEAKGFLTKVLWKFSCEYPGIQVSL